MALMNLRGEIAIVCGSGLRLEGVLDAVDARIPFASIPGLGATRVLGHGNEFLGGTAHGVPVIVQTGRLHLYEGLDWNAATETLAVLQRAGVKLVVFTSAVGGLRENMVNGNLVAVREVRLWPSRAVPAPLSDAPVIRTDVIVPSCDMEGVYHWMPGPCYETQAEIGAIRRMGSDVVGMSLGPEMLRCAELGMQCAAVSCVTNNCMINEIITHEGVLQTATTASARLTRILYDYIRVNPTSYGGNPSWNVLPT
jgi:purine-nucleoside phosphorylase